MNHEPLPAPGPVDLLVGRLRAHAEAHEYIANADPEQKQWMNDLYDAADEIELLRAAIVRANLQLGDGHIEAARKTLDAAMDGPNGEASSADPDYYPAFVCSSCGAKYGRRRCGVATWHAGKCGICGIDADVTDPRDFGHLHSDWLDRHKKESA